MEMFLSALQEYVAEGDEKAQEVIDMLTADDDEDEIDGEDLLQRYIGKAVEDGKISDDDAPEAFLAALREYADEGDEDAQTLLELLS